MKSFLQSLSLVALGALITLAIVLLYGESPLGTPAPPPPTDLHVLQAHFQRLARTASPSVVAVRTLQTRSAGGGIIRQEGSGSGFVFAPGGLILTNEHVIHQADQITVILADGQRHPAEVVGADVRSDLAVLRVGVELPPLELLAMEQVQQGDWVAALGNPLGVANEDGQPVVSTGVVSRFGVALTGLGSADDRHYANMIQTSAAITQGSSGGPLVNLDGRVVGINTAVQRPRAGPNGQEVLPDNIGFAIPFSPFTRDIIHKLGAGQNIRYGWLGVSLGEMVVEGGQVVGVSVSWVPAGGPADLAGIRPGDVVTHFDGEPIRTVDQLIRLIGSAQVGQFCRIGLLRHGQVRQVEARLADRAREMAHWSEQDGLFEWRGLTLRNSPRGGALVVEVRPDSPGARAGLRPEQTIVAIEDRQAIDLSHVRILLGGRSGDVRLGLRGGREVLVRAEPDR